MQLRCNPRRRSRIGARPGWQQYVDTGMFQSPCSEIAVESDLKAKSWLASAHARANKQRAKWMVEHYDQAPICDHHTTAQSPSRLQASATPFIPVNLRRSPVSCNPSFVEDIPPLVTFPISWYPAFLSGVSSTSPQGRISAAAALVDDRIWNLDAIIVLARELCCYAAEPMSNEHGAVAKFTRSVSDRLHGASNEWMARGLARNLRNGCLDMLRHSCHNLNPLDMCSILHLSSFVGDLFVEGLFKYADVKACIDVILNDHPAIENLHILRHLLASSTSALWLGDAPQTARRELMRTLDAQVTQISGAMSHADGSRLHDLLQMVASLGGDARTCSECEVNVGPVVTQSIHRIK
ncbi:hypothetical protein NEOLEDRAFT_775487 [Neolentinus lepideus HHB14362 ss-1]|uniref:Uncharacterized protein n=1 Tax=Neolentinus lepideus HHB14362 ss-1 TaxID=1314782 RepID=A0A165UV93_9AGAM|nr:hypothetical protein NEOLEDRAFT_775487 [Neolentinus lepideus HHB14362 ss-1]